MTYLTEDLLRDMKTKQSGSNKNEVLEKKLVKKERRIRLNNAKEYSVNLYKVFKNKLLTFI